MSFLLDTNICIYIIKKKPQSVIDKLNRLEFNQISISSITVAELEYGVCKSSMPDRNRTSLNEFLIPFAIVNFDSTASVMYGIIRSELERKGIPIGSLDMLIAAQAMSLDVTLVTNNEKEFSRIDGLKIENWAR